MSELELSVQRDPRDPEWDDFVAAAPGGHHLQTTMWAEVKRLQGWRAVRIVARRDGRIAGGCQLLLRRLPLTGCIGYAPRGPLPAGGDDPLARRLLAAFGEVARSERMLFVKVQPPPGGEGLIPLLEDTGFRPSMLEAAPTATVRLDLTRPQEDLLADMHSRVRRNARKGARDGVTIREGGSADIDPFFTMVAATAERQGFPPYPRDYYARMWEVFAEAGHARLLMAEHAGAPRAAVLVIGFGDSGVYKMGGWSGQRDGIRPNELLHLAAMEWARQAGHRWYDFDGIDVAVARALVAGAKPPPAPTGVTPFKLGFGGQVALFPQAYDGSFQPLVRWVLPRVMGGRRPVALAQRLLGRSR